MRQRSGGPLLTRTSGSPGGSESPVVSPDGKWAAVQVTEPAYDERDQTSDLWLVPTDGRARPRRLTATRASESGAAWSADSRRIAFSSRRDGDEAPQIYVLDVVSGGEAQRVTNLSTGARSPLWRPPAPARGARGPTRGHRLTTEKTSLFPPCVPVPSVPPC